MALFIKSNVRTLFGRFEIESANEDVNDEILFSQIASICWDWAKSVTSKCKDEFPKMWKKGEYTALNSKNQRNYILNLEDITTETGRLWKLTFENTDLKKDICWKNTIFILSVNDRIDFSLLQEVLLPESHIGFFEGKISPPRLIREIIDDERFLCHDRESRAIVSMPSFTMNGEDILQQIIDQTRLLPIVIMSRRFDNKKYLITPNKIANKLAGIANVIAIRNFATKQFNHDFGKQWVTNGSIRIHWPKTTPKKIFEEENYDNLFTMNKFISSFEENSNKIHDHIVDLVSKSTASNFVPNKDANDIIQEFLKNKEEKRIEQKAEKLQAELLDEIENEKGQIQILKDEVSKIQKENSITRLENSRLKEDVNEQVQKMETLELHNGKIQSELEVLKPIRHLLDEISGMNPSLRPEDFENAWRGLVEDNEEELEPPMEEEFSSINAAVVAAKEDFSQYILILDDAIESSRKTKSDAKPSDVYQFFKFLYAIMKEFSQKINPPSHKIIKDEYGSKYAEMEANATMERYNKEFNSKGRRFHLKENGKLKHKLKAVIELQPHMKFGSKDNTLRIHFKMIQRISKSTKVWILKNDNWFREPNKDTQKHFLPKPPIAIVGWVGDHLPI